MKELHLKNFHEGVISIQNSAYAIIPARFSLKNEFILRILYSTLFTLLIPVILLRLCWRGLKAPAYFKRWPERFAINQYHSTEQSRIWIHAVSVGEVEATRPLVTALQLQYPDHQILLTTMTPTGSQRVQSLYGKQVLHYYLPYDLPFCMARFIDQLSPALCIIMETELWPNLIHHCHRRNIPLVLANARMSERSAKGYRRFAKTSAQILQSFAVIAAQTQQDKQRLIDLGASKDVVHHTGSLKFEISLPAHIREQAEAMRSSWGNRPVFIAASTHEGEDELILNASRKIRASFPDLLLILVPRHPERFDKVAALSQKSGYKILRRSENGMCRSDIQVLIVDTMGELPLFYASADVAFVGGSLVPTGGHNLLEPAALERAIVVGPHYFNFKEITDRFIQANAAILVQDTKHLSDQVIALLNKPQQRAEMGEAAQLLLKQNQGASNRLLNLIKRQLHDG